MVERDEWEGPQLELGEQVTLPRGRAAPGSAILLFDFSFQLYNFTTCDDRMFFLCLLSRNS
jgi:hypothetical protein